MVDIFDKKNLTERDICTKYITPAIVESAGWNRDTQLKEELSLTKGKVLVRGKLHRRGEQKRADYVLYYKTNIPLAVVEAKDNTHTIHSGIQQAIEYAKLLDVPFAYSSNGDGFIEHDRTKGVERELSIGEFPTPEELWRRYCQHKGIDDPEEKRIYAQDYYPSPENKTPRYYQLTAVNRTIEAIAKGQKRVLLVMATGTGKTYTAFQIIWRLWKAGRKRRILFLADRNGLIDQTMVNDFRPFGGAMAKLSTNAKPIERQDGSTQDVTLALDAKRRIDSSYEVYLGLYQAITGPDELQKLYRELSPDFFDLIVVDECHRGSAAEDAAWREILEYFGSATQIGLTATPNDPDRPFALAGQPERPCPASTDRLRAGYRADSLLPYAQPRVARCRLSRHAERG